LINTEDTKDTKEKPVGFTENPIAFTENPIAFAENPIAFAENPMGLSSVSFVSFVLTREASTGN
jgi:hypothetical protein